MLWWLAGKRGRGLHPFGFPSSATEASTGRSQIQTQIKIQTQIQIIEYLATPFWHGIYDRCVFYSHCTQWNTQIKIQIQIQTQTLEYLATVFWQGIFDRCLSPLVFHSRCQCHWVFHVPLLLRFQAGKVLMLLAITSWVAFTLPIGFIHPPVVRYFISGVQVLYFGIFLVSAIQNLYTVFRYFSLGSQVIFLWPKSFLLQSVERELISAPAPIARAGTSSGSTQLERRYFWPESFLLPVAKRGTGAGISCRSQSTHESMRA